MKLFIIVFSVFLIFCECKIGYDEIRRSLLFAYSAFCPAESEYGIHNWNCYWCKEIDVKFKNVDLYEHFESQLLVYVGTYEIENKETLLISFRGTADPFVDILSMLLDLDWKKVDNPYMRGAGKISQGFHVSYGFLEKGLLKIVGNLLELNSTTIDQVIITGHSLGAANTYFGTISLLNEFQKIREIKNLGNLYIMNYGSPRIGDEDFQNYFHEYVLPKENIFRVVYQNDAASHCPFENMDYHHIATEYWFNITSAVDYKICDGSGEDAECSDSVKFYDLSALKHIEYLGIKLIKGVWHPYNCAGN